MPALIGKFPSMLRMPCGQMELRDLISGCQSGEVAIRWPSRLRSGSLPRQCVDYSDGPRHSLGRPHREHLATGALLVEDEPRALAVEPQVFNDATWSLNCDARVARRRVGDRRDGHAFSWHEELRSHDRPSSDHGLIISKPATLKSNVFRVTNRKWWCSAVAARRLSTAGSVLSALACRRPHVSATAASIGSRRSPNQAGNSCSSQ